MDVYDAGDDGFDIFDCAATNDLIDTRSYIHTVDDHVEQTLNTVEKAQSSLDIITGNFDFCVNVNHIFPSKLFF